MATKGQLPMNTARCSSYLSIMILNRTWVRMHSKSWEDGLLVLGNPQRG